MRLNKKLACFTDGPGQASMVNSRKFLSKLFRAPCELWWSNYYRKEMKTYWISQPVGSE